MQIGYKIITEEDQKLLIKFEVGKTYELYGNSITLEGNFYYKSNIVNCRNRKICTNNCVVFEVEILGYFIEKNNSLFTNKFKVLRIIPKTEYHKISPENFDEKGNLIYIENEDGSFYKYEYDKNDNMIYCEYPNGLWRKWEYDKNGNLIRSEKSTGILEKYEYDENNNITYYEASGGYLGDSKFFVISGYDENNNKIYERSSKSGISSIKIY